jgi:hypothetical protein
MEYACWRLGVVADMLTQLVVTFWRYLEVSVGCRDVCVGGGW